MSREGAPRFDVVGDAMAFTIHDFERDFGANISNRVGALHVLMRPGLLITGRTRPCAAPIWCAPGWNRAMRWTMPSMRCPAARHLCRGHGRAGRGPGRQLLEAETELMEHDHMPDPAS
jgi:hypothetical protein